MPLEWSRDSFHSYSGPSKTKENNNKEKRLPSLHVESIIQCYWLYFSSHDMNMSCTFLYSKIWLSPWSTEHIEKMNRKLAATAVLLLLLAAVKAVLLLLLPAATAVVLFLQHESRHEGIKHSWKFHNPDGIWTPVAWTKIQCSNRWAKESTLWHSCQRLNTCMDLEAMHNLPVDYRM